MRRMDALVPSGSVQFQFGTDPENSDDIIVVRRHEFDFLTRLPMCSAPATVKVPLGG
jgi:hypothetical protein